MLARLPLLTKESRLFVEIPRDRDASEFRWEPEMAILSWNVNAIRAFVDQHRDGA